MQVAQIAGSERVADVAGGEDLDVCLTWSTGLAGTDGYCGSAWEVDESGRGADDGVSPDQGEPMGVIGKPEREIHIPVTAPVSVPLPVTDPASPSPRREETPAEPVPAGH